MATKNLADEDMTMILDDYGMPFVRNATNSFDGKVLEERSPEKAFEYHGNRRTICFLDNMNHADLLKN